MSTDLVRVGEEGLLQVAVPLVPATLGTEWVAISYENRKVLFAVALAFPKADYRCILF